MAHVNLDSQQFYRHSATRAGLAGEKRFTVSNTDVRTGGTKRNTPTAPEPRSGRGRKSLKHGLVATLDKTASPAKGPLSPFHEPAPDPKDIEAAARGTLNGVHGMGDLNHGENEEDDGLPSLEELLSGIKETQESRQAGWSGRHLAEGFPEAIKNGYNQIRALKSSRGEHRYKPIVLDDDPLEGGDTEPAERKASRGSSSGYTSDGSAVEGQDGEQGSLDTQLTSVTDSETGSLTIHAKNEQPTLSSFPPCRNGLPSSSPGKQLCQVNSGGKYIEPSASTGEESQGQCDGKESEVNNKGAREAKQRSDSDSYAKNPPLLRPVKKRPRPAAGEKVPAKRDIKRRRFSLPPLPDEETEETREESDLSSYAPTKPHHTISPRPSSPNLTCLGGHTSDNSEMELGGQSKCPQTSGMAVVYEQQCWEGEIIDERYMKQGRGRPRKQYLVQWKQSWVDGGHLTSPELLKNWKEKKASNL